jgi:hypothetical protein
MKSTSSAVVRSSLTMILCSVLPAKPPMRSSRLLLALSRTLLSGFFTLANSTRVLTANIDALSRRRRASSLIASTTGAEFARRLAFARAALSVLAT